MEPLWNINNNRMVWFSTKTIYFMLYPTKFTDFCYVHILNYMLATRLRPVGTEATKDWECYRMLKNTWLGWAWMVGGGSLKASAFTREDEERFATLWKTVWAKSPAVKEQSFSVHTGALGISPSPAHYIIKRLWKSAEMCWALIPQAELH